MNGEGGRKEAEAALARALAAAENAEAAAASAWAAVEKNARASIDHERGGMRSS